MKLYLFTKDGIFLYFIFKSWPEQIQTQDISILKPSMPNN